MQDDDKKPNQLTTAQRRLAEYSVAIFGEAATSKEAAYMARQLVQVTLPHKNPGDVPAWSRKNGNLTLGIQPGFNYKTGTSYGYPYGIIPRLLLFWIITEAVRTKNKKLQLGHSLGSFMIELGLVPPSVRGGKRSDAKRLREQMERLFNAYISFEGDITRGTKTGNARMNMVITSETMFWWSEKDPNQASWGSWIELSQDFYDAITAAPVPIDMRALRALKKSPLALDLYAWLVYEAFRSNKSGQARFETWEQLHSHLGGDYAHIQHFRAKVKAALTKIKLVYPSLKLSEKQGGIEVLPESLPALQPNYATIEGTASIDPPMSSEPPRPNLPSLKPRTIERFRAAWGRLDPYACQADFEAWIGDEPTQRDPKNYDAAFMGFAKKWVIGKL